MRPLLTLAIAAALAGSAAGAPASAQTRPADAATCVALFKQFDVLQNLYPNNKARYDGRVAQPPVETQAQRVRNAGCITLTRELAGMETVEAPAGQPTPARRSRRRRCTPGSSPTWRTTPAPAPSSRARGCRPQRRQRAARPAHLHRPVRDPGRARRGGRDLALAAGFASPYPASLLMRAPVLAAGPRRGLSAGPAGAATPRAIPATCLATFNAYDTAAWLYPNNHVPARNQTARSPRQLNRADAAAAPSAAA